MAGGKEVTGAHGLGSTGYGSKNRGHRGKEGVRANSPRPRTGSEVAVGTVAAMAGDKEVTDARG